MRAGPASGTHGPTTPKTRCPGEASDRRWASPSWLMSANNAGYVIQSAPGRRTPTTLALSNVGSSGSFSWFFHTSGSDNLNRRWITNLFDFLSELLGWDGDLAHQSD